MDQSNTILTFVSRQNVPITSIHTELNNGFVVLQIASKEMIWILSLDHLFTKEWYRIIQY